MNLHHCICNLLFLCLTLSIADDAHTTAGDLCERGLANYKKGKLNEAIADYDRAIRLDPKYASAYHDRGMCKQVKGDLEGAIADYDRAIGLDPKYPKTYYNRATAKRAKGDLDGAIADCNRAIECDPKYVQAYFLRGVLFEKKTEQDFRRGAQLDPQFVRSNWSLMVASGSGVVGVLLIARGARSKKPRASKWSHALCGLPLIVYAGLDFYLSSSWALKDVSQYGIGLMKEIRAITFGAFAGMFLILTLLGEFSARKRLPDCRVRSENEQAPC